MDVVNKRCAGLDVHKKTVVACVRAPGLDRRRRPMPRHLNHKLTVERATIDGARSSSPSSAASSAAGSSSPATSQVASDSRADARTDP